MDKLNFLGLKQNQISEQRITKKDIYDALKLSTPEQNKFAKAVDKITALALINEDNIRIKYVETDFIACHGFYIVKIDLNDRTYLKQCADLIHKLFKDMVFIVFESNNAFAFSTALKRLSQSVMGEVVIEETYTSRFQNDSRYLELLNLSNITAINLYELYKKIHHTLFVEELLEHDVDLSGFIGKTDLLKEIKDLKDQIRVLELRYSKETQPRERMRLNIEVNNLRQKLNELLG